MGQQSFTQKQTAIGRDVLLETQELPRREIFLTIDSTYSRKFKRLFNFFNLKVVVSQFRGQILTV